MSNSRSSSHSGSHSGSRTNTWVDDQSHISYRVRGLDVSTRSGNGSRSSRHQSRAPARIEPPPPIREHTEQGRNSDENSDSRTVRGNSMAMVLLRPPPPPSAPVSNERDNNSGEVDGSTVRDHSGDMVLFNQQARSRHGSQAHHGSQSHHGSRSHHGQLSDPLSSPPPTPSYQGSRTSVVSRAPAPHGRSGHNSVLVSSQVHTRHASSSTLGPGEVHTTVQVEVIISDGHGRTSSHHTSRRRSTITSKTPHRDM